MTAMAADGGVVAWATSDSLSVIAIVVSLAAFAVTVWQWRSNPANGTLPRGSEI
jgi:hypothetical protein